MARKPTGNPMGRPKKEINWDQFEQLCSLQCTQAEMANIFNIHPDTLRDSVKEYYGDDYSTIHNRYSDYGKCSHRRNQFVLSKKNASLSIWLGKIWLGQRDPSEERKADSIDDLTKTIQDIVNEPRNGTPARSLVENQQSILDKEFRG